MGEHHPRGASFFTGGPSQPQVRLYSLYPPASPCSRPFGLGHDHHGSGDKLLVRIPRKLRYLGGVLFAASGSPAC